MSSYLHNKSSTLTPYRNLAKPVIVHFDSNNDSPSSQNPQENSQLQNSSKSISSKSSAFWPFTKSFEQNNFLSHIISQQSKPSNQTIENQEFDTDPTFKLFKSVKKSQGQKSFKKNQIVMAKCINEPLWPAKITNIEIVPGMLPDGRIYHLKFINEKNTCMISQERMIKFNEQGVEQLRKLTKDKKLIRALKLAEKYTHEQLKDPQSETSDQKALKREKEKIISPELILNSFKASPIELSLSSHDKEGSSQNEDEVDLKHIKVSNEGFFTTDSLFKPHFFRKHNENDDNIRHQFIRSISKTNPKNTQQKQIETKSKQPNVFKPIIIMKGDTLQIQLNPIRSAKVSHGIPTELKGQSHKPFNLNLKLKDLDNYTNPQSGVQLNNQRMISPQKVSANKESSKKQYSQKIKQIGKPMNLVVQTPRLPSDYYLDKVILKLNHHSESSQNYDIKPSNKSYDNLDQTIMQESSHSSSVIYKQNSKSVKILQKVTKVKTVKSQTLSIKTSPKIILKLINCLHEIGLQVEGVLMPQKQMKQHDILEFLSSPLLFTVKHNNYIEYDKLLKASVQIIHKLMKAAKNQLFAVDLEQKLKEIYEFLRMYNGDNDVIKRLKKRSLSSLEGFLSQNNAECEEKNGLEGKKRIVLCSEDECSNEQETSTCPNRPTQVIR